MSDQDFSKMKVAELREMLKLKGLNSVGNKQELVDRLQSAVSESSGDDLLHEDDLLNDDELDEEKSLLDSTHDLLKSPSDSAKSTSPEITAPPAKKVSLKRNISITMPIIESKPEEKTSESGGEGEPDKKVVKIAELSALDRLEMRAKKFAGAGNTTVSSESSTDRLTARAARFGITAAVTSSPVSLDVLKKRAERFGTVIVPELKKEEYQEKLAKRQERFGLAEKVTITAPKTASANTAEYDEKALKRLERFKQTA